MNLRPALKPNGDRVFLSLIGFTALLIFSAVATSAQTVSGVNHTRVHQQIDSSTTQLDRFLFSSFVEGNIISSTDPFTSVSLQGPSVSESLVFDDDFRWSFENEFVGATQAQYSSTYPDGVYALNGNGDAAGVSLSSAYPNQPIATFDKGIWKQGRLVLTQEEAEAGLTIGTNSSTGSGFLSIDIYELETDEEIAFVVEPIENTLDDLVIPGGTLLPGHRYEVYIEFDEMTDSVSGLNGGTTFALASAATSLEIYVEEPPLAVETTFTGPKSGRFDFESEIGMKYTLLRSTNLGGTGSEIDSLDGTGSAESLEFDDSLSADTAAFFWIEAVVLETAPSAQEFLSLIEGKTFSGFSLNSSGRWSQFGYSGDYTYTVTGPQTGELIITWDQSNNDPSEERDVFTLDFGPDGDLSTVDVNHTFFSEDVFVEEFDYLSQDLTQSSYAPLYFIMEELLEEQTHLGYTFDSLSRFTWNGTEQGNYSIFYIDEDTVQLYFTYDSDGNDGTIYREEVDLNFNGSTVVPYEYREYNSDILGVTSSGTLNLEIPETAPSAQEFSSLIDGKTLFGYSLNSNNRWSQFGYSGDYTYTVTGLQSGELEITWDQSNNDPSEERDVFWLDFGPDGDLSTVEIYYTLFLSDVIVDEFDYGTHDLTQSSFAPQYFIIEELIEGQTYLGYTFDSFSRFTWNGTEQGDYSIFYLDEDTVQLYFTYDLDENDGTIYREEVDLNFNGSTIVPYEYREYYSDILGTTSNGTVELLVQPLP
jgi:hypothetical protein